MLAALCAGAAMAGGRADPSGAADRIVPLALFPSDPSSICPRPQTRFPQYDKELRGHFWAMYSNGGTTIYCGAQFDTRKRRTLASKLPINIEHVVPHSRLKGISGAGADPHNLWPSIVEVNAARQNWPLVDAIPGEAYFFAGRRETELSKCDFELDQRGTAAVVEPAPAARGRLARAILHMHLAYQGLHMAETDIAAMLSWHGDYPVSDEERRRNSAIETLTGIRNPFIDFPDHAGTILRSCGPGQQSTPALVPGAAKRSKGRADQPKVR